MRRYQIAFFIALIAAILLGGAAGYLLGITTPCRMAKPGKTICDAAPCPQRPAVGSDPVNRSCFRFS